MLEWLSANAPSVIAAVIAVILALAVRGKVKSRKNGGCGCGCPGCTGSCPSANADKK